MLQAGGSDLLAHAAQVGKAWGEAQHIDEVFGGGMNFDDLLRGFFVMLCDKLQIRPSFPAIEDRNLQHVAGGNLNVGKLAHQPLEFLHQVIIENDARIVMDHEGAVGGNRLGNARDPALLQGNVKGADLSVNSRANLIAELHRHRGIPGEEKFHFSHIRLLSVPVRQARITQVFRISVILLAK